MGVEVGMCKEAKKKKYERGINLIIQRACCHSSLI